MIWVGGRVVPDDALTISALDRAFEHGLGLFETLRTFDGDAPMLQRHLARLSRSAEELGVPLDGVSLPDADAIEELLRAEGIGRDVMLRVTLSGGLNESEGATLWMRAAPLPPPLRHGGAVVAVGLWPVEFNDPLARHKTLNYWSRRRAFEQARRLGYDETLSTNADRTLVYEGSRTNLFLVEGSTLLTPPLTAPIVPGEMRRLVIELAEELPLVVDHLCDLRRSRLDVADEVFLTNSVRGVVPVASVGTQSWAAPGDWTRRLMMLVNDVLTYRDEEE